MYHMEQKSDNNIQLEIVLNLLKKGENHVRGLARDLKVPHTTALRKVRKLQKENAVDSKKEGRNKVFFLRKNVRSRNCVFMAEFYKLNKLLEQYPQMNIIIANTLKLTDSKLIILFGSYAKFIAKKDSDIDLFIETRDKKLKEKIRTISSRVNLKTGTFNLSSALAKEIIKEHVIIRGVEEFYEKTKLFE